jgi:hypothetical protein
MPRLRPCHWSDTEAISGIPAVEASLIATAIASPRASDDNFAEFIPIARFTVRQRGSMLQVGTAEGLAAKSEIRQRSLSM